MTDFGAAHERYLAGYSSWLDEAWCSNKKCENHLVVVTVRVESEYGQSWATPEECAECGSEWVWEKPDEEEE